MSLNNDLKEFSEKVQKELEAVAAALRSGKSYEDLQKAIDNLIGPLDPNQDDVELNERWERNYRNDRE